MKKAQAKSRPFYKQKKLYIWIGAIIVLYIVSLFVPLIKPFTQYPLYFIKCGKPPVIGTQFAGSEFYVLPGKSNYAVDIFSGPYFCSEDEANASYYHYQAP